MSTRTPAHKAWRALSLAAAVFAVALLAAAPVTSYAQRGGPGGVPGGQPHPQLATGGGHGHAGNWRGGVPGGWHGARRHGGFGWPAPAWAWAWGWGWGWGFPGGGLADATPAPSPYAYRFLYDSPYYYPDYDSYHGFSYRY